MTDEERIRSAARGDLDAFTELLRPRQDAIRAFCARLLPDSDLADDLAQDVLLAAFQSLKTLQHPSEFDPWLRGIARNKVRLALRRQAVRKGALQGILREEAERRLREETRDDGLLEALRACVATLGDKARHLVDLFYRERRPAREASSALGMTEGAFYTTLTRVRQSLRKCVGERMGETWA
jgi:RNA polymerase sigma-70 factor (ECF subfamily)